MNVLVTGGGGYIGTVLIRQLAARKDIRRLRVLDRFTWGTQPLASIPVPRLEVLAGSVTDPGMLDAALHRMDAVIHLAAVVGYRDCDADPLDAEATNVDGTRLLCERVGSRRVIFASTGSTYGKVDGICTEATPISPLTRYGRTKADGEQLVAAVGGITLRFATLFGLSPRMRWDLLPHDFVRRGVAGEICLFEPEARRTFLHVEDAADALAYMLTAGPPGSVFNVGHERFNLSKRAVAHEVWRFTGCRIEHGTGHDPDGRDYAVSYQAVTALGWIPHEPFDLAPVVDWARVWR